MKHRRASQSQPRIYGFYLSGSASEAKGERSRTVGLLSEESIIKELRQVCMDRVAGTVFHRRAGSSCQEQDGCCCHSDERHLVVWPPPHEEMERELTGL